MNKKPKRRPALRAAAAFFEAPAQVALGVGRVTVTGSSRLLVENHRGIISYSDSCIQVACGSFAVCIHGSGLGLGAMNKKELTVLGNISAVTFGGAGEVQG